MNDRHYTTLSIATVETPASNTQPVLSHLIGCAMLTAEQDREGIWAFRLEAVTAKSDEAGLIQWLVDHLQAPTTVIGWQVGDRLLPALLDAIAHAEAPLAHRFASVCARTFTAPCGDPAIEHGGAAAPPFAEVAALAGFDFDAMTADETFTAWAFSSLGKLRQQLEQETIALWQLWLSQQPDHLTAMPATAAWLEQRG